MPPQEASALLDQGDKRGGNERITINNHNERTIAQSQFSFGSDGDGGGGGTHTTSTCRKLALVAAAIVAGSGMYVVSKQQQQQQQQQDKNVIPSDNNGMIDDSAPDSPKKEPTGPYKLLEAHQGESFLDYYDFYEGPDSLGSAGFNTYVSKKRAADIGLFQVKNENGEESILLQSAPTEEGPRESIRLEGKRRFDRGLFILDVDHMPAGCGVWPAFWLTDEEQWPDHGEIDIVEGVNYQNVAKTALHTSDRCDMYAHVPGYAKSGYWDSATGIPNTWTGEPDYNTLVEADDCWVMAPHQWANQGCVAISSQNGTMGAPLNDAGGGIFALEWDPANHYIRSWVFPKIDGIPSNLQESIDTAATEHIDMITKPDTDTWGLPYAYFAIGETTGCSADHFQNMRLVINLAFCGTVSGNRYFTDCPFQSVEYNISNDPVWSCNAWIQSQPKELDEAYFKIRGVYVYDREDS